MLRFDLREPLPVYINLLKSQCADVPILKKHGVCQGSILYHSLIFPENATFNKKNLLFLVLTHLLHIFATWPRGPHVSEFPHGRRGKARQQQPHQKAAARLELIGETSSKWWIYAI